MKSLLAVCFFFVSSYVFADHHDKHMVFKGSGQWVKKNGEVGKYKVEIDGTFLDNSIMINEVYKMNGKDRHFSYRILKTGHGFAEIMKDGVKIGESYCFKSEKEKVCHQAYTYKGVLVEKTFHKRGDRVKRIGSVRGLNYGPIKFKEKLRKQDDED